jgi:hypothetical protein
MLKKLIKENILKIIKEQEQNNLVLYRGVEDENMNPTDMDYAFFAEDITFAEDYGEYIWKCSFKPLKLFISFDLKHLKELYNNNIILRDFYIEDMWDKLDEDIKELYNYDENISSDEWGYKSAEAAYNSRYTDSDTWEMIERTPEALDYILSKYDGVKLLEGGEVTYYIDTNKIISCSLI